MAPDKLQHYSFIWLLLMLTFSALAMFLGGRPPITFIVSSSFSAIWSLLSLFWIVSGAASLFLLYTWNKSGKQLFGGTNDMDKYAFFAATGIGINIGLAGLLGNNLLLSIVSGGPILTFAGIVCAVVAYRLYSSWNSAGRRVF